jgi:hypothetical protein
VGEVTDSRWRVPGTAESAVSAGFPEEGDPNERNGIILHVVGIMVVILIVALVVMVLKTRHH